MSTEVDTLHGRSVLVLSQNDTRNPPVSLRGTVDVSMTGDGQRVAILIDDPQMFKSTAQRRTLWLSNEDVSVLLASERNGALQFSIAGEV